MSKWNLLRWLFVLMIAALVSRSYGTSPVVTLLVMTSEDTAFGTGSFVSSDGLIVTCYHVIQGATAIRVINQGRLLHQPLTVETIDTMHDLATLRIRSVDHDYFPIDSAVLSPAGNLKIFGYIAGYFDQSVTVHATGSKFGPSGQATSQGGHEIFALQDVGLIALNTPIYNGMSGSPLTQNGRIVGVVSGSNNHGENFAWAIPIKHLNSSSSRLVRKKPNAVTWSPLRLMGPNWSNMRRRLSANNFTDDIDDLVSSSLKVMQIAGAADPQMGERAFQGINELKLMIDAVPQAGDALAPDKSPGFSQIITPFFNKYDEVIQELAPFRGQLDDMNDVLSEWDDAADDLKEKLKALAMGETVAPVELQLQGLTDKIRSSQHSLENDENACIDHGEQADNHGACPSSEALEFEDLRDCESVGAIRQTVLRAVALESTWYRQMRAFEDLGGAMPQVGEVIQGLLGEKILRNAEAHFSP